MKWKQIILLLVTVVSLVLLSVWHWSADSNMPFVTRSTLLDIGFVETIPLDVDITETPTLKFSIIKDMKRCSKVMGVSTQRLKDESKEIERIAERASRFLTAVWEVIPAEAQTDTKNPCWNISLNLTDSMLNTIMQNIGHRFNRMNESSVQAISKVLSRNPHTESTKNQHLYCLPYFFLSGFPKCGTTTLASVLTKHPQIVGPDVREIQWWTRTPLPDDMDEDHVKVSLIRYLMIFETEVHKISTQHQLDPITFDSSQSLMVDSNFGGTRSMDYCAQIAVVSRVIPNAKFIIVMRNPIRKIYSAFFDFHDEFSSWPEEMKQNPPSFFHREVSGVIERFQGCTSMNKSAFECRSDVDTCGQLNVKITEGTYHTEIFKWMLFYPRENFLFLKTEDLSKYPVDVINNITNFLGLDPVNSRESKNWFNTKSNVGSFINKYKMLSETKQLLYEFFLPYNQLLAKFLGDSRFLWKQEYSQ